MHQPCLLLGWDHVSHHNDLKNPAEVKSSLMAGPSQIPSRNKTGKEGKRAVACVQVCRAHSWLQTMLKEERFPKAGEAILQQIASLLKGSTSTTMTAAWHFVLYRSRVPSRENTHCYQNLTNQSRNQQAADADHAAQTSDKNFLLVLNCRSGFKSWVQDGLSDLDQVSAFQFPKKGNCNSDSNLPLVKLF